MFFSAQECIIDVNTQCLYQLKYQRIGVIIVVILFHCAKFRLIARNVLLL